jgi:adenylate kinase family enzyme
MPNRIHIFGASGSGTTTLGAALASELGIPHLDTDAYYWKKTEPPFVEKNAPDERVRRIEQDIGGADDWILSGSLVNWGGSLVRQFTIAVFLYLDPSVRIERLRERESERYGDQIRPGGDMYEKSQAFIAWAKTYETAKAPVRSIDLHEKWMKTLSCPVVRLDSGQPVEALVDEVISLVVV